MIRSRFLDHIDLRVKNLEEADAFYRIVLPALGFPKRNIEKTGVSFDSAREHTKPEFISLIEDPEHVPNKTRIAFWCDSQTGVDDFGRTLKDAPAKNVEGPMFCPEYSPNYYAVFFEDPCGNRLEVCCRIAETAEARKDREATSQNSRAIDPIYGD